MRHVLWALAVSVLFLPGPVQAQGAGDLGQVLNSYIEADDPAQQSVLAGIATTVRALRVYAPADVPDSARATAVNFVFIAGADTLVDQQVNPARITMLSPALQAALLAKPATPGTCRIDRTPVGDGAPVSVALFLAQPGADPQHVYQCFSVALWNHFTGTTERAPRDWRATVLQLLNARAR